MFGNSKKKEATPVNTTTATPNAHALNSIVKGTNIEGTIDSENDIRIDGSIKGTLTCKAKVIIGPTGVVEGEITCENALIEGKFVGELQVASLLHVKETALIDGDVHISKLIVDPGAKFNVTCNMGAQPSGGNRATADQKEKKSTKKATA